MICKAAYFEGSLSIGQLNHPDVWLRVQTVAKRREPELLGDMLGSELYGELLAGLTKPADAPDGWMPQERWSALEAKVAGMVAAYVFYRYVRESGVSIAGAGAVKAKTDNARSVIPDLTLCDAWNTISYEAVRLRRFISDGNREDTPRYPSYRPSPCRREKYRKINTLGI